MGARPGSKNALGNRGGYGAPSVVERDLSKKVRNLTLTKIVKLFEKELGPKDQEYELYKAVLVKLAGSVLPRINEGTGEGGSFVIRFDPAFNGTPRETN
jgi:hypothetical protein